MQNIHGLSIALQHRTLRSKLYLMQLLVGEWELSLAFSIKRQTLRDFINGTRTTPPPRVTEERLQQIVGNHIKFHLPSDTPFRLAQLHLLSFIDPTLPPPLATGKRTPSRSKSRTTNLVRDYIISQRVSTPVMTMQQIVEHFQSPEWLRRYGYPLNEQTVRSALRRVLGKWPELAESVTQAKRGRRPGSKISYGEQ